MNELLEFSFLGAEVLWGIAVWRLVFALVLLCLGFFSRRVIRWIVGRMLRRRKSSGGAPWAEDLLELLPRRLSMVLQILLWYAIALILELPQEPYDVRGWIINGLLVAAAVAFTGVVFRLLDAVSRAAVRKAAKTQSRLDDQLVPLLRKSLKTILAIVIGVSIADKMGFSVASLIASLSIGGLALALAAKDTVANVFGSAIVFTDRLFHVGDVVNISDVEGVVEEVGVRTTRIRRFDKALATIPNQIFANTTVVNHSSRESRRIKLVLGLTYAGSPQQLEAFLSAARQMLRGVSSLENDASVVYITDLAESGLKILVQGFTLTADYGAFMTAREEVLLNVMKLVEEHGMEIAFPARRAYFQPPRATPAKPRSEDAGYL